MAESPAWKEKYLEKYLLSPSWMGSKEFSTFVAQSEQQFKTLLTELGLLK
jgi:tripartite-type tricarboxylate transporter receptor subunit TctC